MSGPQLSICIATLNRGAFIGETLDSILSQTDDRTELIILDGGSTDNTEAVVRGFASGRQSVRYYRQDSPGGVDRDFDRTVELATGRYCWLMSDDDLLKAGAVEEVLRHTADDYSLIIVNGEVRNASLNRVLERNRLNISEDRRYNSSEMARLLEDAAAYLSFIGAVVVKRQMWLARRRETYYGSCFIHVGVIFQDPLPDAALVVATPYVVLRLGNASWTTRQFEIWMFKWPTLIWSFTYIPERARRHVCAREPWRRPTTLLVYRAMGAYSQDEYERLLRGRLPGWWERVVAAAIARVPGVLINAAAQLYYSLFFRRSGKVMLAALDNPFHYRQWLHKLVGRVRRPAHEGEVR